MWELIQSTGPGEEINRRFLLVEPRSLVVGRFDSDIVISDKSISRKHATLDIKATQGNGLQIILKDSSKFGTFVNEVRLRGDLHVQLYEGDQIRFGTQPGVLFSLKCLRLCVAVSSMNITMKKRIQAILHDLGGVLLNNWTRDCSYLVMPNIVVTSKVVCALLQGIPIVNLDFMESYLKAASKFPFVLPNPVHFLPSIKEERFSEEDATRFLPDKRRCTLFEGKRFCVLTSEKHEQLTQIIELGTGQILLLDSVERLRKAIPNASCLSETDTIEAIRRLVSEPGTCVVHTQCSAESKNWQRIVYTALRAARRRPILESELGYAVVHCSIERYCNPQRRCPDVLYQEAGVSQAFSINPFHIDSQTSQTLVTEQSGITTTHSTDARLSLKRMRPLDQSDINLTSDLKTNSVNVSCNEEQTAKRKCLFSNLLPPVKNSAHESTVNILSVDSEQPRVTPHRSKSFTVVPGDIEAPLDTLQNSFQLSNFSSQLDQKDQIYGHNDCDVDSKTICADAFAALDSMPSLMSTTAYQPSTRLCDQRSQKKQSESVDTEKSLREQTGSAPVMISSSKLVITNASMVQPNPVGWLRKQPETNGEQTPTELPNDCAIVLTTNLTVNQTDVCLFNTSVDASVNYKIFQKVWPLHMQAVGQRQRSSKQSRQTEVKTIRLEPYMARSGETLIDLSADDQAQDEQRERVNKLFEQMCQIPRNRL